MPLVILIFERNLLGVGELAQALYFTCLSPPVVPLLSQSILLPESCRILASTVLSFHLKVFSFLTCTVLFIVPTSLKELKNNHRRMGKQTQSELQSAQRSYLCQGYTITIFYSINRKCPADWLFGNTVPQSFLVILGQG